MRNFIILLLVTILLGSCSMFRDSGLENSIKEKYWKLVYYNDENIIYSQKFKREPHIIFKNDGRINGNGGCNGLIGSYKVRSNHIIFSPIASTLILCGDVENQTEYKFLKVLNSTNKITYEIQGDTLTMYEGNNKLVFKTVVF